MKCTSVFFLLHVHQTCRWKEKKIPGELGELPILLLILVIEIES